MANLNENLLFVRSEEADNNDPWDDTILIRAYDAAIANCEQACRNDPSDVLGGDPQPMEIGTRRTWKKWDRCRAVYNADGLTYEAIVIDIKGDQCTVRFKGYGNKETVLLSSLTKSNGNQATKAQVRAAENDQYSMKWEDASETGDDSSVHSRRTSKSSRRQRCFPLPEQMMPPPPPPPMFSKNGEAAGAGEAYHAMLMSWYMSGYHTGYYECLKQTTSKN